MKKWGRRKEADGRMTENKGDVSPDGYVAAQFQEALKMDQILWSVLGAYQRDY